MSGPLTATDRLDILDVLARYGHAIDAQDWDLLRGVLSEDFLLVAGEQQYPGFAALRASVAATNPLPAHHIDSTTLAVLPDGRVRAWSKFLVVREDGWTGSGDYLDTLSNQDGSWRIVHRDVRRRYAIDGDTGGKSRRPSDAVQWREGGARDVAVRHNRETDAASSSARQDILELLYRYGRAIDDRDWGLWETLFTADAQIDFSRSTWGPDATGWALHTPAEVRQILIERSDPTRLAGQHLVLNSDVRLDGQHHASVHSEFLAVNLTATDDPERAVRTSTGGWYTDSVVRERDGAWRIHRRASDIRWQSAETVPVPPDRRLDPLG